MKTEMTADIDVAATPAVAPKTAKLPVTSTITLTSANGTLQLVAERKGEGARSLVLSTDAAKKTSRGMTKQHATFEAAKAATEKMADEAEKLGWQRPAARRGFIARPDAFATLPTVPKGKK